MSKTNTPEVDYREAFRDRFLHARGDDGKYRFRGQERALLNAMSGYVDPKTGTFFMSQARAALVLGTDERQARRVMAGLREAGLLTVESRGHGSRNGSPRATTFRVGLEQLEGTHYPLVESHNRVVSGQLQGTQSPTTGYSESHNRVVSTPLSSSTECQRSGTTTEDSLRSSPLPDGRVDSLEARLAADRMCEVCEERKFFMRLGGVDLCEVCSSRAAHLQDEKCMSAVEAYAELEVGSRWSAMLSAEKRGNPEAPPQPLELADTEEYDELTEAQAAEFHRLYRSRADQAKKAGLCQLCAREEACQGVFPPNLGACEGCAKVFDRESKGCDSPDERVWYTLWSLGVLRELTEEAA